MNFQVNWISHEMLLGIKDFFSLPVFPDGEHKITLAMALHLVALVVALFYSTALLRRWLIQTLLAKVPSLDVGLRHAIGTISSYAVLAIGLLIILDTAGVDITVITVMAGALGLGISLSLQNIMSNFMSGLIILLERPVKVGDRVEVGNIVGQVADISLRSATVITSDNIAIIVPNNEFISSKVTNWSYSSKTIRLRVPVSVSRKVDPQVFSKEVIKLAINQPDVLRDPPPDVLFKSFSESSQNFVLLVWCKDGGHPEQLQSRLNFEITKVLRRMEKLQTLEEFDDIPTPMITVETNCSIS